MPNKKVISIEQSFDKVTFHITGEDNFLNTLKVELDVYSLAELLLNFKNKIDMEKEFVWTDELVKEFMDKYNSIGDWIAGIDTTGEKMIEFKKSKEEVKPTVNRCNYSDTHVYFHLSGDIPEIEITKERLAEILINEQYMFESVKMGNKDVIAPPQTAIVNGIKTTGERYGDIANENYYRNKMYTHKEYIQALEDCYNASRLTNPLVGFKYDTFSDYMNCPK